MSDTDLDRPVAHDVAAATGRRLPLVGLRLPDISLSRLQSIVGLAAAVLSIGGALYGFLRPSSPAPVTGEVVTIVQEARSSRPVDDATIEILTPKDAVITTLTSAEQGRARSALHEGAYRLRVSHPRFAPEIRQVQVVAGQTAEVRVRLTQRQTRGSSSPRVETEHAVDKAVDAIRRLFR